MILPRKEIEMERTEKEERKEKKEEFNIKRFLNENRRLIAGGVVSILFLANLILYFVLIVCFLILALYEKSEKTKAETKKKKGIVEMTTAYIKKQYETNPWWIFWGTVAGLIFLSLVAFALLLVIISLILR